MHTRAQPLDTIAPRHKWHLKNFNFNDASSHSESTVHHFDTAAQSASTRLALISLFGYNLLYMYQKTNTLIFISSHSDK